MWPQCKGGKACTKQRISCLRVILAREKGGAHESLRTNLAQRISECGKKGALNFVRAPPSLRWPHARSTPKPLSLFIGHARETRNSLHQTRAHTGPPSSLLIGRMPKGIHIFARHSTTIIATTTTNICQEHPQANSPLRWQRARRRRPPLFPHARNAKYEIRHANFVTFLPSCQK